VDPVGRGRHERGVQARAFALIRCSLPRMGIVLAGVALLVIGLPLLSSTYNVTRAALWALRGDDSAKRR
jgi:hypothetical protein